MKHAICPACGSICSKYGKTKTPAEKKREKEEKLMLAFEACDMDGDGKVKLTDLAEYMELSLNTVKNYVDESRKLNRESGTAVKTVKNKN